MEAIFVKVTALVYSLAAASYLSGVFLVTQVNPRYFGAAWPVLIPLLFVAFDAAIGLVCKRGEKRAL